MNRMSDDINDPNSLFQKINRVFEYLPLAATISNKIFCVSSGIGQNVSTISEISKIKRPLVINNDMQTREGKIVMDLLWSDPVLSGPQNTRVISLEPDQ